MSLSQTRLHIQTGISFYDKIYHFLLYSLWSFPVFIANPKSVKFFFIFMILYGGLIEVIQPYFNRSCEIVDFIANTLGVLFSYCICFIAKSQ